MKILIENLKPNPFRNINQYPIDKNRVEKLKASIKRTNFWGGLVCRPDTDEKNKYQLAFGHHRLQALKEIGIKEITIKAIQYSDAQMLQAMADENRETGQHDIRILINTIEQVKKYLDEELAKYENIKELPHCLINLLDSKKEQDKATQFGNIKSKGVGQTTILKFLGSDWKQSEIQFALNSLKKINDNELDREAIEMFPNKYQAEEFTKAIKNEQVSKTKQKEVAKKVIKEMDKSKKNRVLGGRNITQITKNIVKPKEKTTDDFQKAEVLIENITASAKKLLGDITILRETLKKLNVTELKGLKVYEAARAIKDLKINFKSWKEKHNEK